MKSKISILLILLGSALTAQAMDLSEFLHQVEQKHGTLKSLAASEEAATDRRTSGDLDLVPSLLLNATYTDDKRYPNQFFQLGATETKTTAYTLGVNKKFSSGTSLGLSATAMEYENPGAANLAPGLYFDKFSTGSLGISVSQSLWKDFFGAATRLRWEREMETERAEKGGLDLQRRQLLVQAEATFWDFIFGQEDLRIRQSSLDRSQKILNWTKRRMDDGISDKADYYQSEALVASRQLQLLSSQDDFLTVQKNMRDLLELGAGDTLPKMEGDLSTRRSMNVFVQGKGRILQLDAYLSAVQAKARAAQAREVEESFKPDLVFQGAYSTNSYEPTLNTAVKNWNETDKPTTTVGLKMVYLFDTDVKGSASGAARKDALAARLLSERKNLESESAWSEINRHYNEMSRRIESAQNISVIQKKRADAEGKKFNQGRSITINVVNSEQDAAEAELSLNKMKAEQRKMEARGRLFIGLEETL
jgi:outer membrane protein TolC